MDESVHALPRPIFGLPCHDECKDGEYADIDWQTRQLICSKCQKNTYSIGGGGIRIDGSMGAFGYHADDGNAMPLRMEPSCKVDSGTSDYTLRKNESCTPWSRTGTSLKAYQSSMSDVLVDFDLTYPVYFDEQGSVEFKYRKDSIGNDDAKFGVFKFFIDDERQLKDDDPRNTDWQIAVIDKIPAGYHSFVWRYTKLNVLPFTEFMEAEIESITVRGRHSNRYTQCYPCNLGYSGVGAGKCELCPENKYFFVDQ